MLPIVANLLSGLAGKGLGLLASAVEAKGKEAIESVIGATIDDDPTDGKITELLTLQYQYRLKLIELAISADKGITDRWVADAESESWLATNIRPLSLIAIFLGYFLFAMMSAFGFDANEAYVTLLGNWGMLIMGAYFGGRTIEKVFEIKNG